MLIRKREISSIEVEAPKGGEGKLFRWDYIKEHIPCSKLSTFSYLELEPGASIGKHQHTDNFEVYYFLEGSGRAFDDDNECLTEAGDMLITEYGSSHALINSVVIRF